jgi:hypothetical protein
MDIAVIAFTATLCGSDEFEEMPATFANGVGALPNILAVKENQPALYRNIKDLFDGMESGEIRDIRADLKTIIQYRTHRTIIGGETVKTGRYFTAARFFLPDALAWRSKWTRNVTAPNLESYVPCWMTGSSPGLCSKSKYRCPAWAG